MENKNKYQQGTELGYNNVDHTYSGSMSTYEGEMMDQEDFFVKQEKQENKED